VLREDGKLTATSNFGRTQQACGKDAAERSKKYVQLHWKFHESGHSVDHGSSRNDPADFLEQIQSQSLCISGMAFQDAWNIDLERLRRCCIHVITKSKQLIPFCAYYLTDSKGYALADRNARIC